MSLLQQAKQVTKKQKTTHFFSKEEIELALGWAKGEVTLNQVHRVIGTKQISQVYHFVARALRQHFSNKKNS